jgi:hypothetical protein
MLQISALASSHIFCLEKQRKGISRLLSAAAGKDENNQIGTALLTVKQRLFHRCEAAALVIKQRWK